MRSLKSYETFAYALTWKYTTREDTQGGGGLNLNHYAKNPFFIKVQMDEKSKSN